MDISRFKDVIRSVFKNYSSLLVPAVIGLIALLVFVPTQLMSSKLKKRIVNESITNRGKKIQRLRQGAHSRYQYREEQKYQQAYEKDANGIDLLTKQSTQRELLSYEIFPEPKDVSAFIFEDFGKQYRKAVRGLLARVNARDCPTDAELDRGLEGLAMSSRTARLSGKGTLHSRLREARTTIVDVLCREKAESASVYANPSGLSGYRFWEEYEPTSWADAIKDCWYWQLSYWIIEDIIDTIDTLNSNSGSNSVLTSPVKQLVSVSFPTSSTKLAARVRARSGGKAADEKPKYVVSVKDVLTKPCTGRLSNKDIDVVHFNVIVVVSTRAIFPFMQQICSAKRHKFRGWDGEAQEQLFRHNQITILESKIESIDQEDSAHELYRYGEDAVVELNLICEYVFDKASYDKVKPKTVKGSIKESLKKLADEKAKAERMKMRKERKKAITGGKAGTGKKTRRTLPEIP